MQDKVCMVTGATSGIGKVTARELAANGAEVIVVSRSEARCYDTVETIRGETGNPKVDYLVADLSSMQDIRRLVDEFHGRWTRLDVLVNNAGGFFWDRRETDEGLELTFALNHLNYFLLTNLLLNTLIASGEPGDAARIVNVASDAHRGTRINFADLQGERSYSGWRAYGQSKLANILFTFELVRRLKDHGLGQTVTANAVHPGFVATGFGMENNRWMDIAMSVMHLFARSPEQGAETSVYLASSPEVEGLTGMYFSDCRPVRADKAAYDPRTAERLWRISAEMTGLDEDTVAEAANAASDVEQAPGE